MHDCLQNVLINLLEANKIMLFYYISYNQEADSWGMGATDRGRWVIRILSAILLVGAVGAKALRSNDYCIIGAGPSGIQMGSFLQSVGRDYVIYERGNVAGEL